MRGLRPSQRSVAPSATPPGSLRSIRRTAVAVLLGVGVFASGVEAEIRVKTLADGTKMIYNETVEQRSRRVSGSLVKAPDARIGRLIVQYARYRGLDPRLVQAVVQVESGYNPSAVSVKGAQGLMQLMPATAEELGVENAFDPEENLSGGTLYLRKMLQRYNGSITLALAAYNAGPTAVDRYDGIPPYRETRNYVRKILHLYHQGRHDEDLRTLQPMAHVASRTREQEKQLQEEQKRQGEKVYLTRDENNQIVFTTAPPDKK